MSRTLSAAQLARALVVKEPQITRWKKRGLPHDQGPNGRARFDVDEVRAWIATEAMRGSDRSAGAGPLDELIRLARRSKHLASASLSIAVRSADLAHQIREQLKGTGPDSARVLPGG